MFLFIIYSFIFLASVIWHIPHILSFFFSNTSAKFDNNVFSGRFDIPDGGICVLLLHIGQLNIYADFEVLLKHFEQNEWRQDNVFGFFIRSRHSLQVSNWSEISCSRFSLFDMLGNTGIGYILRPSAEVFC